MSGRASTRDASRSASIDALESFCFGCGPDNPQGLRLNFTVRVEPAHADVAEGITALAHVTLTDLHQGAPGYLHGGIIATLLDEAMSKLNGPLGMLAVTRHLEVDYLRPAPIKTALTLTARHLRREGRRKLFHEAQLAAEDGTVLARAKGLFIVLDPAMLPAALR